MSMDKFTNAASIFQRRLAEGSPLEAPIRGFNRYDRDMHPGTRELVLKARMPEIMAFSEDRRLDPAVVAGVVEATMRLGRIPDLGLYGLAGDEALAVRDFVATAMLGLEAELAAGLPQITESHDKIQKHKAHAEHYRALANHHGQAIEFHTQAASKANKEGKPFTAAKHQAKITMLKQLHASHAALANYHDEESARFARKLQPAVPTGAGPENVDQPTGQPEQPAHPAPGSTASQRPEVPAIQKQEQTVSASLSPMVKPVGMLKRTPLKKLGTWKDVPDREEETNGCMEQRRDFFRHAPMLEDLLAEAERKAKKKAEKKSEKPSVDKKKLGIKADPDKIDKTIANVKIAPLFQQLGHKMDHAYAKLIRRPVKNEWKQKLFKLALSKGGGVASDEIVKSSLADPWIRDQGFVEEGGNLRAQWATMMSSETQENALKASPTSPEPIVFTINRMIDISQGKGSIY
jgi:hypothetical protein